MTDKDRKARDERVKLRALVEQWKTTAKKWESGYHGAVKVTEELRAKLNVEEARVRELRYALSMLRKDAQS
jgi:hypothetical protein